MPRVQYDPIDGPRLPRLPTAAQRAALDGTTGNPDSGNPYVTTDDPRLVSGGTPVIGEAFTGDGVTVAFVLSSAPVVGTVAAYINGVRVVSFTVAGSTVTFTSAPALGDEILFDYVS